MNKDIAMKWADALESGEYQQVESFLHTEKGYCCLGVLCELSGLGSWTADNNNIFRYTGFDSSKYTLPLSVMNWAELKTRWS